MNFSIGELSKRAKCSVPNIRYYEKISLLPPAKRSNSGHRYYNECDIKRLTFVIRCRMLGFTIREIKTLLQSHDGHQIPCSEGAKLAAHRLKEVQLSIIELKRIESILQNYIGMTHEMEPCSNPTNNTTCAVMSALEEQL